MNFIVDASALLALLRHEPGGQLVRELLSENDCSAHVVNLCETYYTVRRRDGEARADEALDDVGSLGVAARGDLDTEFWKQVGVYKAELGKISLGDCFCLALATRLGGEIITSDTEFNIVVQRGICPVRFIR